MLSLPVEAYEHDHVMPLCKPITVSESVIVVDMMNECRGRRRPRSLVAQLFGLCDHLVPVSIRIPPANGQMMRHDRGEQMH